MGLCFGMVTILFYTREFSILTIWTLLQRHSSSKLEFPGQEPRICFCLPGMWVGGERKEVVNKVLCREALPRGPNHVWQLPCIPSSHPQPFTLLTPPHIHHSSPSQSPCPAATGMWPQRNKAQQLPSYFFSKFLFCTLYFLEDLPENHMFTWYMLPPIKIFIIIIIIIPLTL